MMYAAWMLAAGALLVIAIAAFGVLSLGDALSRQHAVTKAATLGLSLFSLALMLAAWSAGWNDGWTARLLVLMLFLVLTLPLASHALARAALKETGDKPMPKRARQTHMVE
jgi:multicomponent Na+:H+ antiporter subunit G